MIKMALDQFDNGVPYLEKCVECWHCERGILFKQVVPCVCPKCGAKQPFAEHLLGINKEKVKFVKLMYYKRGEINDAACYNFHYGSI